MLTAAMPKRRTSLSVKASQLFSDLEMAADDWRFNFQEANRGRCAPQNARYALECIDSLLFVADEIKEGKYDRVKKELKEIADGPNPDDIGG